MSIAVEFEEPSAFVVHASGAVTFDEAVQLVSILLAHPRLDGRARVLIDGRQVLEAPTTTELRAIAREMKPLRERGLDHVAIVADNDFIYGVARMFALFAQSSNVDVGTFRDIDQAKRWLAVARAN